MTHMSEDRNQIRITRQALGRVPGEGLELAFGYWPGRGSPLVALHGLTATHVNFIGIAECLRGRRAIFAPDLRGRGDSDKPAAPYGLAQHARDVAAAMRTLELGPSTVVGHSLGAFVATALAAQEPALVKALVLIDGGYVPDSAAGISGSAQQAQSAALIERIVQLRDSYPSREAYRQFWRAKPHFPAADWSRWVEQFLDYEVEGEGPVKPKASEAGVRVDLAEGLKGEEIRGRLAAIRVPIVFLRAEHGFVSGQPPLFPDAMVEEIRRLAPQIEDHKFVGATHYTIVLGRPGASAIAEILARLS
jgi:lipase